MTIFVYEKRKKHQIMTNAFYDTRKFAVDAIIEWAKTGEGEITMRNAVGDYLVASCANLPSIGGEETIIAHRKIALNRLVIDCMYALSRDELSIVEKELDAIAQNVVSVS